MSDNLNYISIDNSKAATSAVLDQKHNYDKLLNVLQRERNHAIAQYKGYISSVKTDGIIKGGVPGGEGSEYLIDYYDLRERLIGAHNRRVQALGTVVGDCDTLRKATDILSTDLDLHSQRSKSAISRSAEDAALRRFAVLSRLKVLKYAATIEYAKAVVCGVGSGAAKSTSASILDRYSLDRSYILREENDHRRAHQLVQLDNGDFRIAATEFNGCELSEAVEILKKDAKCPLIPLTPITTNVEPATGDPSADVNVTHGGCGNSGATTAIIVFILAVVIAFAVFGARLSHNLTAEQHDSLSDHSDDRSGDLTERIDGVETGFA